MREILWHELVSLDKYKAWLEDKNQTTNLDFKTLLWLQKCVHVYCTDMRHSSLSLSTHAVAKHGYKQEVRTALFPEKTIREATFCSPFPGSVQGWWWRGETSMSWTWTQLLAKSTNHALGTETDNEWQHNSITSTPPLPTPPTPFFPFCHSLSLWVSLQLPFCNILSLCHLIIFPFPPICLPFSLMSAILIL